MINLVTVLSAISTIAIIVSEQSNSNLSTVDQSNTYVHASLPKKAISLPQLHNHMIPMNSNSVVLVRYLLTQGYVSALTEFLFCTATVFTEGQ